MENMLRQILLEVKSLSEAVKRIEDRLERAEYDEQSSAEHKMYFEENTGTRSEGADVIDTNELEPIWKKVLDIVKKELTDVSFKTWLENLKLLLITDDTICLGVESEFVKSIIECRYSDLLKTALKKVTGRDFNVEFYVTIGEETDTIPNRGIISKIEKEKSSLNPMYSFDTLVVGEHNKSAYIHAYEIAQRTCNNGPLYIHGEVGIGKTHLLQAIGNYISEREPDVKLRYLSIDDFTNEMVIAIGDDNTLNFKKKLLDYDVLLIDNLQLIAGKEATQGEFSKIVSEMLDMGKQIVIATTEAPQNMTMMNERFTSIFELGGVFEIKRPELDTRLEILKRRRAEKNLSISDEELICIADSTSDNVRELLNAFTRYINHDRAAGKLAD